MWTRMRVSLLTFLVLALLPARPEAAQPARSTRDKAAFQRELAALKRPRPAEFEQAKRIFTLAAEQLLARLRYGVGPFDGLLDEKTEVALRSYEKLGAFR